MSKKMPAGKSLKNVHAAALGEKGGVVGGPARAKALTAGERSDIARKGGKARAKKAE